VGSGGLFKTPDPLAQRRFQCAGISTTVASTATIRVVAHFDRIFDLGLSAQDRRDLVAYLTAVGDGARCPMSMTAPVRRSKEVNEFANVLATAIPAGDKDVVALRSPDTIGHELRSDRGDRFKPREGGRGGGGGSRP